MDESKSPWPLAGGLTALCLAVLVGGGVFALSGTRPEKVTTPTSFSKFTSADKTFQCEYPSDWGHAAAESAAVVSEARFRKGSAVILVTSDLTGSLIGDIPAPGGSPVPDLSGVPGAGSMPGLAATQGANKPAVERVHAMQKKSFETELKGLGFNGYEEEDTKKLQTRMGDGRYCEFTAKGGFFDGNIRGYRATFLGTERAIYVTCRASVKDWDTVKAAFERVIGSVAPGGS